MRFRPGEPSHSPTVIHSRLVFLDIDSLQPTHLPYALVDSRTYVMQGPQLSDQHTPGGSFHLGVD